MPEYLAPGVYVEEVSFRSKSIEGVGTTTTGFVGPTRYGPLYDPPDILTSLADFERIYGDGQQLDFGEGLIDNYLWQAVRAFFAEGGSRLYVKRIFSGDDDAATARATGPGGIGIAARYPGAAGEMRVAITLQAGQNVLATQKDPVTGVPGTVIRGVVEHDVVLISRTLTGAPGAGVLTDLGSPPTLGQPPAEEPFAIGEREYVYALAALVTGAGGDQEWQFTTVGSPGDPPIALTSLDPAAGAQAQVITASVSVTPATLDGLPLVWPALPLDPAHRLAGAPDSLADVFSASLTGSDATPIVVDLGGLADGLAMLYALGNVINLVDLAQGTVPAATLIAPVMLEGGGDGAWPGESEYEGEVRADDSRTGLVAFEDFDDIAIVATPGATSNYSQDKPRSHAIINALITHAQKLRYRIAVIDSGKGLTIADARDMRAQHDTEHAAFYYPWVTILDPITKQVSNMPPSGFVAGIYGRNDTERAVFKAPANEVVNLAIGFERPINKAQQEVLNPEGINCFRYFEGRGYRLWGARLMSSDPEWPYVNLRRYFAFLEHSIDLGTQWAVFEPNGELLWANVRSTIAQFLLEQWREGALLGDKPEKAYFVRCDRSTMTQNDIDNGRLVCLVGVAVVRPAEFVIFRIGQWTADANQ